MKTDDQLVNIVTQARQRRETVYQLPYQDTDVISVIESRIADHATNDLFDVIKDLSAKELLRLREIMVKGEHLPKPKDDVPVMQEEAAPQPAKRRGRPPKSV